jgi:hypothetical protein
MRSQAYVEQSLAVLGWPPAPDVAPIFSALALSPAASE